MAQAPRESKSTAQPAGESDKTKAAAEERSAAKSAGGRTAQEDSAKSDTPPELATEKPPSYQPEAPSAASKVLEAAAQPAPPAKAKSMSVYVVVVDDSTGLPTKIERLNEQTGERKELSTNEYAQVAAYSAMGALPAAAAASGNAFVQAYMQGIADYFKNVRTTP